MSNRIVFDEKLSTYSLYTKVLERFYDICLPQKEQAPVLDFCNTRYIFPAAVPVLLSFGDYLSKLYQRSIEIVYVKGSELHNFFVSSNFYEISKSLNIFEWDEDTISAWEHKELRDLHKISYTDLKYSDAEKIEDLTQRRNYIYDCLLDRSKVAYGKILRDTNQLPESIVWATINAIAEIGTNAIMYSGSHSFTYMASDRYGTNISVADSGVGFWQSFLDAKRPLKMSEKFKGTEKFRDAEKKFQNYLTIMSALNYSFEKHLEDDREDLWTLRTNVINNNGTFKIQYENTQVIFSCNRCAGCRKNEGKADISMCVQCLRDKYSADAYSPIKIFNIGFQGVRIEITINRER